MSTTVDIHTVKAKNGNCLIYHHLRPESLRLPIYAVEYDEPDDKGIEYLVAMMPTTNTTEIEVIFSPGVTARNIGVYTFFRCRNKPDSEGPWVIAQVINYLTKKEKPWAVESIATAAKISEATVYRYILVSGMNKDLWYGGEIPSGELCPSLVDIKFLYAVPMDHQKKFWDLLKHLEYSGERLGVMKIIMAELGFVFKAGQKTLVPPNFTLPTKERVQAVFEKYLRAHPRKQIGRVKKTRLVPSSTPDAL